MEEPDRKFITMTKNRDLVEQVKRDRTYEEGGQRWTDVVVHDLEDPLDPEPGWALWGVLAED